MLSDYITTVGQSRAWLQDLDYRGSLLGKLKRLLRIRSGLLMEDSMETWSLSFIYEALIKLKLCRAKNSSSNE